jgi:formylglycine-generating enzyme required for sulfatase activity
LIIGAAAVAVVAVAGVLAMRSTGGRGTAETASVPAGVSADPSAASAAPVASAPTGPNRTPAAAPVEPAAVVDESPCPDGMVYVGGGKFFMGTDDPADVFYFSRPARQVEVAPYCIAINEVTVGEYRQCSGVGECKRAFKHAYWPKSADLTEEAWANAKESYSVLCNERYENRTDHPVNCVTWEQADSYCAFKGWRLPREAEWEFAARGSDGREFSWGDQRPSEKNMNGCGAECRQWRIDAGLPDEPVLHPANDGFSGTAPVGSFPAGRSANGLNDMVGNVFEWMQEPFVRPGEDVANAHGKRVIRGGAFNSFRPQFANPALRVGQTEDAHVHAIGFRCAADPVGNP